MSTLIATAERRIGLGFGVLLRAELAKTRRLRLGLIGSAVVLAGVLFTVMPLFSASVRATTHDPGNQIVGQLLLGGVMSKGLLWPVLAAVLASRLVDIEHVGNGWFTSSSAGFGRGTVCRAKWLVLAGLTAGLGLAHAAAVIAAMRLAGLTHPLDVFAWVWEGVATVLVTWVLLGGHVWLAARSSSQLAGLGVGLIGGLLGAVSLLMPPWLAMMHPWGYYALSSPFTYTADATLASVPPALAVPLFVLVALALFAYATARLNREDS